MRPLSYAGYRFPPEIIQHAIWLYLRFTLSFRDVEELLAERGIDVSHETIRRWVAVFGPTIARRLRSMRPSYGQKRITGLTTGYFTPSEVGISFRRSFLPCLTCPTCPTYYQIGKRRTHRM
jgi:IS30 family transposase